MVIRTGNVPLQGFMLLILACVMVFVSGFPQDAWAGASFPKGDASKTVIWATGNALMPAWGFYPNSSSYGGTKPLGGSSAWTAGAQAEHTLTWVADFPTDGVYHLWTRQYGGYGRFKISVDEKSASGWINAEGTSKYIWQYHGQQMVSQGKHHVDMGVRNGMLDAVLFTLDSEFDPERDKLPRPTESPVLRELRRYRDDSYLKNYAGETGLVVGKIDPYMEVMYDWLPRQDDVIKHLQMWGAANQYVSGTFCVRALEDVNELKAILPELVGPRDIGLTSNEIDLRVVYVRRRSVDLFWRSCPSVLVPELLLRDGRTELPPAGKQGGFGGGVCTTSIPRHESRQLWVTVHIPAGSPPGTYRGSILLGVTGSAGRKLSLPIEIQVLGIELQGAEGYYSIYYPSQPNGPDSNHSVTADRYFAELKDQVRHGLNSTSLYGGFGTLPFAKEAGMTKPPCIMAWPDSRAVSWVSEAKKSGFGGLVFYGIDEPTSPEAVEKCRKEAQRRQKLGLSMLTAINSSDAQSATRDVIDYPVYNIYVFSGRDNEAVMYARRKGFKPISYWMTSTPFPLCYRALTGLYNKACGYVGSMPWSYQDVGDNDIYDPNKGLHKMAYPDEYGEPIPTLCWEAHRDGIDDVRYLEVLDRTIAKAQEQLGKPDAPPELAGALKYARGVRKKHFEDIQGRWFEYLCGLEPGELDTARRVFADAATALDSLVHRKAE